MKNRSVRSLVALQRLRKLKEDEQRLDLAASYRESRKASEASDAGERRLESLATIRLEGALPTVVIDLTRHLFLGERYRFELDVQGGLEREVTVAEHRLRDSAASVADAWKNHSAVKRKRSRRQDELRHQDETRAMDESNDLWLARKEWLGHD